MNVARRILRQLFRDVFVSRVASRKLKHLAADCRKDVTKLVTLAYDFEYKPRVRKSLIVTIKPLQIKTEIAELCRIVQKLEPKKIVEIGTASGGTLFLFANITNPEKIVSVDLPSGSFGCGYPSWKIPFFRSLGNKGVIQLIRADSHSQGTLRKVKTLLKSSKVDFLFIDGDHTYQGVKEDYQMYSPLVKKGGIIAFHDIVTHDQTSGCEVDRFWHEIKQNYRNIEIIDAPSQKWAGIGLLYL